MNWYSMDGTKPPLNKLLVLRASTGKFQIGKLRLMNNRPGFPKIPFYASDKGRLHPSLITHWLLLPEFPSPAVSAAPASLKVKGKKVGAK